MISEQHHILYEDDLVYAMLEQNPAGLGHIVLMPKTHFTIIEQVPMSVIDHLAQIANKLSVATFESLGAMGTNIIIANGVPAGQKSSHFMINIIPRWDKDGLNFAWKTKQASEEELSSVEMQIKQEVAIVEEAPQVKHETHAPASSHQTPDHNIQEGNDDDEEDYRIQALTRLP